MKRWIHSASDPLRNADPFQAKRLGWNYKGSEYARGKADFESAKEKLFQKYGKNNVKVFRTQTDTPGMMMYDVYTRIVDEDQQ